MYRLLMILVAADGAAFGLGNLLLSDTILSILGGEVNALGDSIFRTLGGAILGYGVVAWFLRDLEDGPMRRGVIGGVVISFATIAVVVGLAALAGLINLLGWAVVGIHAVVATGLLLVLFSRPPPHSADRQPGFRR